MGPVSFRADEKMSLAGPSVSQPGVFFSSDYLCFIIVLIGLDCCFSVMIHCCILTKTEARAKIW